jgi:hypothetical protein
MSNRVLLSALRRDQCRARRTRSNDGAAQTERRHGAADALFFYIDGAPDRRMECPLRRSIGKSASGQATGHVSGNGADILPRAFLR